MPNFVSNGDPLSMDVAPLRRPPSLEKNSRRKSVEEVEMDSARFERSAREE
jgi:hypothetical protein